MNKRLRNFKKSGDNSHVVDYLKGRGIDEEIILECIENDLILEEKYYPTLVNSKTGERYKATKPYYNIVFLGSDFSGKTKYASWHSIGSKSAKGIIRGSQKEYAFQLVPQTSNPNVHVFKSEIDLLSYATLLKLRGFDWKKQNMITIGGIYKPDESHQKLPIALKAFFKYHPTVQEDPLLRNIQEDLEHSQEKKKRERIVYLHLEDSELGRNQTQTIEKVLQETTNYTVVDLTKKMSKMGADVNEILQNVLKKMGNT